MPSKTCLSACAYIWELWWNRQIISKRGKQVRSKKTSMNKSKSFNKIILILLFFSLSPFFVFLPPFFCPHMFHAPCAHYKEKKRQVCIILNKFVVVVVHLALAALLKQDGVRFFFFSFFLSLFFVVFPPPPPPHPHLFFLFA